MRNISLNKFQSVIGVLLFSTNTERSVQSIFGRLGLSVAYSSTVDRLYSMSDVAASHIRELGQKWMRREASFHIVSLESGTAATLIIYPSNHPDAFNAYEYAERRRGIRQKDITVAKIWQDVDCKHQG